MRPHSQTIFTDEDIIHLLAWLDFTNVTGVDFSETVGDYLIQSRQARGAEEYLFENQQALLKLSSLARNSGVEVSRHKALQAGSSYFPKLSQAVKTGIKREFAQLMRIHSKHLPNSAEGSNRNKSVDEGEHDSTTLHSNQSKGTLLEKVDQVVQQRQNISKNGHDLDHPPQPPTREVTKNTKSATSSPTRRRPTEAIGRSINGTRQDDAHKMEISYRDIQLRSLRRQWQDEVDELKLELRAKKEIETKLRVQLHHVELARAERKAAGHDRLDDKMSEARNRAFSLQQEVQDLKKQRSFVAKDRSRIKVEIKREIQDTMRVVSAELESILHGHGTTDFLRLPASIASYSDLASLIRAMSGDRENERNETSVLEKWLLKYDAEVVIRSFFVAALRDWVFATDFPNLLPSQTRLLKAYRKTVALHDGLSGLHDLELISYHSIIEDEDFQENVVNQNATDAAARLSRALAPFFTSSSNIEEDALFHSWGESKKISETRMFRFIGIFKSAFKLKALTVLTGLRYEFVIFPPGTKHAQNNYTLGPAQDFRTIRDNQNLLLASLYMFADLYLEDSIDSALINSRNFVTMSEAMRRDSADYQTDLVVADTVIEAAADTEFVQGRANVSNYTTSPVSEIAESDEDAIQEQKTTKTKITNDSISKKRKYGAMSSSYTPTSPQISVGHSQDSICDICGKKLSSADNKKRHKKNNSCPRCAQCQKYFPSKESLKEHVQAEHPDTIGSDSKRKDDSQLRSSVHSAQSNLDHSSMEQEEKDNQIVTNGIPGENGSYRRGTPHRIATTDDDREEEEDDYEGISEPASLRSKRKKSHSVMTDLEPETLHEGSDDSDSLLREHSNNHTSKVTRPKYPITGDQEYTFRPQDEDKDEVEEQIDKQIDEECAEHDEDKDELGKEEDMSLSINVKPEPADMVIVPNQAIKQTQTSTKSETSHKRRRHSYDDVNDEKNEFKEREHKTRKSDVALGETNDIGQERNPSVVIEALTKRQKRELDKVLK